MRILGIDPGSLICGFGVIECKGKNATMIEHGVVHVAKAGGAATMPLRMKTIFERIEALVERTMPDEVAIESVFHAKNANSLIKLSHARASALLPAVLRGIPVAEYAPREVKKSVTGNGNADKTQVSYMVMNILNIAETPEFNDVTDALAVALCHNNRCTSPVSRARSWSEFVKDNPDKIKRQ